MLAAGLYHAEIQEFADIMAQAGASDSLLEAAQQMRRQEERDVVLRAIAIAKARAGQSDAALALARSFDRDHVRAGVLARISAALAQQN